MLKNLSPLLSGALLTALDAMEDGETLTLVGSGYPEDQITTPVVHLEDDVTTEAAAEAILSVFPLDPEDASPIVFLDLADEPYDVPDVAFAVNGIASDAELRRVPMTRLELEPFLALARNSTVTVRVGSGAPPCAFLLRRGSL
ncbi:RbsD/FucU family protein [Leifsonia xyli]|uniref:RbsD/FucU family protein n=1 Tax=Leifsonia xyli TaxID=1575 RepID=UPI003D670196